MRRLAQLLLVPLVACGASPSTTTDAGTTDAAATGDGAPFPDSGPPPVNIGTWTDAPGACPAGTTKVELSTVQQIVDASRGDGAYAADAPQTCYLIKNGTYVEAGALLFYILKGGSTTAARRFVGESRAGVIIHGRGNVADGADHVVVENLTFDLTGYVKAGSFNTFDVSAATDVTFSHVTFTGDCMTGLRGGHIEVNHGTTVLIDACLVENFGQCGGGGHEDHGIYLASGGGITIRNSDIRGNSSRGILMNTQQGTYGQLQGVLVEYNRIHDNGHADYEDGIAVNMEGTGDVNDVTIRHNLIYDNYYSGLRFVGAVTTKFDVQRNTFYGNGTKASGTGRSNLNLDAIGSGASTVATKNIFANAKAMLNSCYDATNRAFAVIDNVNVDSATTTGDATCISGVVATDPGFASTSGGDFHTTGAAGYGAY